MKENEKGYPRDIIDEPIIKDNPKKELPHPEDPNEEITMPNKEMPAVRNPHDEEKPGHTQR